MYKNRTILAVIPARGGSKGLPRKNVLKAGGKPLIAWTIEAARRAKYLDRVIVSSEDPEILRVAARYGCEAPFVRPAELSRDDTPGVAPVLHALRALPEKYDLVVLLQPTSPLRAAADIDACVELCVNGRFESCVSVTQPDKSPYWMFLRRSNGTIKPLLGGKRSAARRQDLPKAYALNGAVYAATVKSLQRDRSFITRRTAAWEMPAERALDIDTRADLQKLRLRLRGGRKA